jgi:hypothetical protein
MLKNWGWHVIAVIVALAGAFFMTCAKAQDTRTHISIYSTPGPAHNSAPRFHHGPNSHPPPVYYVPPAPRYYQTCPPVYFQPPPPVYYVPPAPRYYQTCPRWDGWRQQYIYVPC